MRDPPPDSMLPELRSKYKDRFREHATATLAFVLDTRRPPFDQVQVRRGVAHAVDGPDLKRLLAGRLEPGCTLLPAGVPGHESPSTPCPYGDPTTQRTWWRPATWSRRPRRGQRSPCGAGRRTGGRVVGYWVRTLRKIGLRPRLVSPRQRANTWLAERAPEVPHPAPFFGWWRPTIPCSTSTSNASGVLPLDESKQGWAKLDTRVIDRAYLAPFGSEKRDTFLSERLDSDNCARFNPVYGNDYSSFCLK